MNNILLDYEMEMIKIDSYFESAMNNYINDSDYAFAITESTCDEDTLDYLLTEASEKFTEKVKKVFDAIIEAIKSFIKKTQTEFRIRITQHKLHKKINTIEALVKDSKKLSKLTINGSEKRTKKDIHTYYKEYKTLLDMQLRICYKIMDSNSVDEIEKLMGKIDELSLSFHQKTDVFTYSFFPTVTENIYEINRELREIDQITWDYTKMIHKYLETVKDLALKAEEQDNTMTEKNDDSVKDVTPAKVSALKNVANKMSSMTQKAIKAMTDHPFKTLAIVTGTLAAAGVSTAIAVNKHNQSKTQSIKSNSQKLKEFNDGVDDVMSDIDLTDPSSVDKFSKTVKKMRENL